MSEIFPKLDVPTFGTNRHLLNEILKWADNLVQAQNQLHGIPHAAMGKRSICYVEKAMRKAERQYSGS